jgi:hypothetical protein
MAARSAPRERDVGPCSPMVSSLLDSAPPPVQVVVCNACLKHEE